MHAHEMYAYKIHAYEIYAREMHTHKMQAHIIMPIPCTGNTSNLDRIYLPGRPTA
jgi:hypothetical protein